MELVASLLMTRPARVRMPARPARQVVARPAWMTRPARVARSAARRLLQQHGLQVGEQLKRLGLLDEISWAGHAAPATQQVGQRAGLAAQQLPQRRTAAVQEAITGQGHGGIAAAGRNFGRGQRRILGGGGPKRGGGPTLVARKTLKRGKTEGRGVGVFFCGGIGVFLAGGVGVILQMRVGVSILLGEREGVLSLWEDGIFWRG